MPPPYIKTVRDLIFYQYAKIMATSAGFSKEKNKVSYYRFIMDRVKKLKSGDIKISNILRELKKQMTACEKCCEFCGAKENLSFDHLIPLSRGGSDNIENQVLACKSCNSSKGNKGLYAWYGEARKDELSRVVAGKYLKLLYDLHDKRVTLDKSGPRGIISVLD